MTENSNPLAARQRSTSLPGYVTLKSGDEVPTDLEAYCNWLNDLKFWGRWHYVDEIMDRGVKKRIVAFNEVDIEKWCDLKGYGPNDPRRNR